MAEFGITQFAARIKVSTHSHAKVADHVFHDVSFQIIVSTHSHAKVAEPEQPVRPVGVAVSTHSHAKVAELHRSKEQEGNCCFNTQPREGG